MENHKESSDGEDIPSDFFDDFNKEEFMEGLSVIDSWDDEDKKTRRSRSRIHFDAIDNVRDLRELIIREENDGRRYIKPDPKYKWSNKSFISKKSSSRQHEIGNLDDYIKPGSRRDPNKTNEAIRRDKEVKVKEYLSKHLESGTDLCPPGTELDYFDERKSVDVKKRIPVTHSDAFSPDREHKFKHARYSGESPVRRRETSPRYRRMHGNIRRQHHSPHRNFKPNMRYLSPHKNFRKGMRFSPRRVQHDFRRERRSKSPYKRYRRQTKSRSRSRSHSPDRRPEPSTSYHRSHSSNRKLGRDDFLYPKDYFPPPEYAGAESENPYKLEPQPQYTEPVEYVDAPMYSYNQGPSYSGYGVPTYEYGVQPPQQMLLPSIPQPVPAPVISSTTTNPTLFDPVQTSAAIIPPHHIVSPTITNQSMNQNIPETISSNQVDALAKLVADGKLSHEDYLKLAPNKGVNQNLDTHTRVAVLNRCHNAMSRLGTIVLPNQLFINNSLIGPEQKQIAPKFCSPLKRQMTTEFYFSKYDSTAVARQNKLIVETIVAALDIGKVIGKTKKTQSDTKDVAVQTMKPFCDFCAIRENTKFCDAETSIDRDQFSSTVHTQVVEQDLVSSKSVFNPTGGVSDGPNISIAHMTPAQLVSQLAARAKTLKQSEPSHSSSQFRQPQSFNYDGRARDNQYRNNNYRY